MATTPTYALRYPTLADAPNGPAAVQNLATDVEAQLVRVDTARMGTSLRRVAAQTLPTAAFTPVTWDTEDVDTNAMFAPPGTTITLPAGGAGVWAISTTITVAAAPTGLAFVAVNVNGGTVARCTFADNVVGAAFTLPLSAGATVSVDVYRTAAAATTMTGNFYAYRVAG